MVYKFASVSFLFLILLSCTAKESPPLTFLHDNQLEKELNTFTLQDGMVIEAVQDTSLPAQFHEELKVKKIYEPWSKLMIYTTGDSFAIVSARPDEKVSKNFLRLERKIHDDAFTLFITKDEDNGQIIVIQETPTAVDIKIQLK